ncbi:rod shape-determining protein MreC [Holzapfeliella floricola]|uniref:Cell shape-determining protein MreC n=1 Tax=Holzapfeliella floricola DSM 23037 = JCM 16512 TaxID=1423744 RepID=A0A0R2DHK7_9LACO|nr:rod shape-determining protein MreC [Holzapfeliella floricola]KRN03583.1 rod shape-determining protein MreC [Holzapfeliella floricola DSM 23037 = JCM 16512]
MKKILKNKKIMSILAILIVVVGLVITSTNLQKKQDKPFFLQTFLNDSVSVVTRVINVPVTWFSSGAATVSQLANTYQENENLKKQLDDLAQTKVKSKAIADENEELKEALDLKKTLTGYKLVNASIISRPSVTWSNLVIIDQGSQSGIEKGMTVMADKGVVGRVLETDSISSKVELISTTSRSSNRFSVQTSTDNRLDSNIGVISGYDTKTGTLSMTQVSSNSEIKPGTQVYTSGLGDASPKGLLIGTVEKSDAGDYGFSNIIKIKPAANINNFSVVSVVLRNVDK